MTAYASDPMNTHKGCPSPEVCEVAGCHERAGCQRFSPATCSASSECLEPCRIRDDGLPEFDGTRWESGMHLMGDLCRGRLPEPCWIRNGRSSMKIDPGESITMGRGIMLGYDVTEYSQNAERTCVDD